MADRSFTSNTPDTEVSVRTFIPTAYAMLEEIEAQLQQKLKQLEIERLRFVAPYIRDLDIDREGYEEWERIRKEREVQVVEEIPEIRHFLPEPEELKWLDAHDRARERAGDAAVGWW